MGLGGNLIWTAVLHSIAEQSGEKPVIAKTPLLTDFLAGALFKRGDDYRTDQVFLGNSEIAHPKISSKSRPERLIDCLFEKMISLPRLRSCWEHYVYRKSLADWKNGKQPLYVHIDMRLHSYAEKQTKQRTFWKTGGTASSIIAANFGFDVPEPKCRFFPTSEEEAYVDGLLASEGITKPFIVIEPDTNRDWFGELRAWPFERWQELVYSLNDNLPQFELIQTGLGRGGVLDGVRDFTNKTSFREAASLLDRSTLFIGTEGGLMHLSAAVNCRSVVLWGGLTLPEFIGYPHQQRIICHRVSCAPCGNAGWCDNEHLCMRSITVKEVYLSVLEELKAG
ncbi:MULTISPECIES: glycosyltransferase family 9 protein [Thalassospira]|uniref:Glycosyl transferase family 9 n=1 Tax=Thalassospira profundimaris TaxID=502049 RepID=A0A367VLZ6_9PROT|nr:MULTISPECIES: glycosyltransferase family 9 protein [Thalassospira]KZB70924.1 hypothetical protein AUQ43_08735 [Thalassospira sp. MCCC 1A01148]MBR9899357.1 glycosyltransferase family 9 protein [Rhodospirillales bacterium]RCK25432.1 hypothetical protein TH6_02120 [Thalassospira profundimaris]